VVDYSQTLIKVHPPNLFVFVVSRLYQFFTGWLQHWHGELLVMFELVKNPEIPLMAKFYLISLISYILSPIDIIPDFIPIFGHWDDIAAIPLVFILVKRITPHELIERVRIDVENNPNLALLGSLRSKLLALVVVAIWLLTTYWFSTLLGVTSHLPF
jgi:uncharacterized membrane protein YkvA (DUF1232 family)